MDGDVWGGRNGVVGVAGDAVGDVVGDAAAVDGDCVHQPRFSGAWHPVDMAMMVAVGWMVAVVWMVAVGWKCQ